MGHRTDRTCANLATKTTGLVAAVTLLVVCGAMALVDPLSDEGGSLGAAAGPGTKLLELVQTEKGSEEGSAARMRLKRRVLTNSCTYTMRGIPSCGVLVGAAYGGNTDPLA